MSISQADRIEGAVWGSFVADSIALGVHWIYDPKVIEKRYGRLTGQVEVPDDSYHKGKSRGDFTHLGDQTLMLLRSVCTHGGFDAGEWAQTWRESMEAYDGYMDKASKATLAKMKGGEITDSGSDSTELAGAARIAPVVFKHFDEAQRLDRAARAQAHVTHATAVVEEAAAYFANSCRRIIEGEPLSSALAKESTGSYPRLRLSETYAKLRARLHMDATAAVQELGASCAMEGALPGTLFLLMKHGESLEVAFIENAMAGGDSAARGLLLGALLGAAHGINAIPEAWRSNLRHAQEIRALLAMEPTPLQTI